jgi:hypothetical protein
VKWGCFPRAPWNGNGGGVDVGGGVGAADAVSVDSEARGHRIEVIAGVDRNNLIEGVEG